MIRHVVFFDSVFFNSGLLVRTNNSWGSPGVIKDRRS